MSYFSPNYQPKWSINSPNISVQNYEIDFEPFLYQIKLKSRFEVIANFNLPPKTLFARYHLPNQTLERVFLIKNNNTKCFPKYSKSSYCYVYEASGFINLAGDNFFKRQIDSNETIPIEVGFELDGQNLSMAQSKDTSSWNENKVYFDFLDNLGKYRIKNSFKYQNFFHISKNSEEPEVKTIKIATKWKLSNQNNVYHYKDISFLIPSYSSDVKKPVKDWFSVKQDPDLKIKNIENYIYIAGGDKFDIPRLESRKTNDVIKYEQPENSNIYIPSGSSGYLKSLLLILYKNNSYKVEIKNNFGKEKDIKQPELKISREYFRFQQSPKQIWI